MQIPSPVRVVGWPGPPPERPTVTELAAYLVLNPGGHSSTEVADALSNPSQTVSVESVRTYISALRRALGSDALPKADSPATSSSVSPPTGSFPHSDRPRHICRRQGRRAVVAARRPVRPAGPGAYEWVMHSPVIADIETVVVDTPPSRLAFHASADDVRTIARTWPLPPGPPLGLAGLYRA